MPSTIGVLLIEAVNSVLRGAGQVEVSATATIINTSNDEAGDALRVLERATLRILGLGWPENTERSKAHTPIGAGATSGSGTSAAFVDGAWTASSLTLTSTGSFASFVFGASGGDEIYIYSPLANTAIREGYYPIASRVGDNAITLTHTLATADATDVGGRAIGDLNVTLGSNVLAVNAAGPDAYRNLVLNRDEVLWDADRQTSRFETDDAIHLDVTREYTFENISPQLRELVVSWSRYEYQGWQHKISSRDATLLQEALIEEARARRNPPDLQKPNTQSAALQVFAALSQQQGNA